MELEQLNEEFKKHKRRSLLKKYLLRLFIIIGLSIFITSGYTAWVIGSVSKKITSQQGAKEAKKVLVEKKAPEEPLTLLLLGSDSRGKDPGRADTIILVRLCSEKKRAVLISIPRDYMVSIPGRGKGKINLAYAYGGAKLMIQTVSNYLDIDVNHYVAVDFSGFKKIVDALGGITVDVEKRMFEQTDHYVNLYPGVQNLNGAQALSYVRFRGDSEGDFGRIRRQQKFLNALADKFLTPAAVPKYPTIAHIFADNLESDMTVSEMIRLARTYSGLKEEDVQMIILPGKIKNIGGGSYVIPEEEQVKAILHSVITKCRLPEAEFVEVPANISVIVLNGTGSNGLARAGSKLAKDFGLKVIGSGNADKYTYVETLIIYSPGKQKEAEFIRKMLSFGKVKAADSNTSRLLRGAQVGIILGFDSETHQAIKERMR